MQPSGLRLATNETIPRLIGRVCELLLGAVGTEGTKSYCHPTVKIGEQIFGNRQRGHQRQHGFLLARERKNC